MLAGALAGISEHAVMYPVDSIKVRSSSCFADIVSMNVCYDRRECKCIQPNLQQSIQEWDKLSHEYLRQKVREDCGEGFLRWC